MQQEQSHRHKDRPVHRIPEPFIQFVFHYKPYLLEIEHFPSMLTWKYLDVLGFILKMDQLLAQPDRQKVTHKSPPCNLHMWDKKWSGLPELMQQYREPKDDGQKVQEFGVPPSEKK